LSYVDHPKGTVVYPDERFAVSDPQPSETPILFRKSIYPVNAVDHQGKNQTETVRKQDGNTVNNFKHRGWIGYAEDHWLEFNFGAEANQLNSDKPIYLVLTGWTNYPYPESIIAAGQAGIDMNTPVLERKTSAGWVKVIDVGFPAGLPKTMMVPLPANLAKNSQFRIKTNLQIYWDELFVAEGEALPSKIIPFETAELSMPGFVKELRGSSRKPEVYDPNKFEKMAVTAWQGNLTKLGNVNELINQQDDRFVICGPGDEVSVAFDARNLADIPNGMTRTYILQTKGYCKDTAPTTLTGANVLPLPYSSMTKYPPEKSGPDIHQSDLTIWHTRPHQPRSTITR
jgi:hypothetical protein